MIRAGQIVKAQAQKFFAHYSCMSYGIRVGITVRKFVLGLLGCWREREKRGKKLGDSLKSGNFAWMKS